MTPFALPQSRLSVIGRDVRLVVSTPEQSAARDRLRREEWWAGLWWGLALGAAGGILGGWVGHAVAIVMRGGGNP